MNYKIFILFFFVLICSCKQKDIEISYSKKFNIYSNQGFTLIYEDSLFKESIVNRKIENRSLIVFNNNLDIDTPVKITNPINGKYLIAKIGKDSKYPVFYNSVISSRIADELKINPLEPYIKIQTIASDNLFIANKAKTFKEEKKVANKAPVQDITIQNIGISNSTNSSKKTNEIVTFIYIIKIADLYFKDSAIILKKRLNEEFDIKDVSIKKISENNYRVFLGPFNNLESIKKEFNNINKLNFENIEFIKL